MMSTNIMSIIGNIYRTQLRPDLLRIIAVDDFELFYDGFCPTLNKWTFSGSRGKCFYYRTEPSLLLAHSELVRKQPLTEDELSFFQPGLPFRVCRIKELQWVIDLFASPKEYKEYLKCKNIEINDEVVLDVSEVVLYPYGPKCGLAKPSRVSAQNGRNFTELELLWTAQSLQHLHLKVGGSGGTGIYRLGHEKGVPSYYIGHYSDAAGLFKG